MKQSVKMNWQEENEYYKPKHDSINEHDRKAQISLTQTLETASPNGSSESAICRCGAQQKTAQHVLQDCLDFASERNSGPKE